MPSAPWLPASCYDCAMAVDLAAAQRFMTAHARVLDRRRFELLVLGSGSTDAVLAALDAFRNPDGGYGWGLEPDLRSPGSQPVCAYHAFEILAECGAAGERARAVCDWVGTVACADGGIPFVAPVEDATAVAPWFAGADPTTSSFHGTVLVAFAAVQAGCGDHPVVQGAVRYCLAHIAEAESFHAYELAHALRLLDALGDDEHLARLAALVPPSGRLAVEGGLEDEALRPLDYAPSPTSAVRRHVSADAVEAHLDDLEAGQLDDGGWDVDFASFSAAATLEWRGFTTLRNLVLLHRNGRL